MRRPRNRRTYQRMQGAQRTAQPFVRVEAPVGGWNTRDSEDNVPPIDALEFDNWWPDIGEVRTRPGHTLHCNLGDTTTGSDMVLNGGFETPGGGGADVFANWTETNSNGTVAQTSTYKKAGTYSCELSIKTATGGSYAQVAQTFVTTALTNYGLKFWWQIHDPSGTMTNGLQYRIWDNTAGVFIKDWSNFKHTVDEFTEERAEFVTPASCISVIVEFKTGSGINPGVLGLVDVVTLYQLAYVAGSEVETLAEYISGSNRKMLAAADENLYNVTTSTPTLINEAATTYDNARWQWLNFDGKLLMVNGVDKISWSGGATVAAQSITYDNAPPAAPSEIAPIGCNVFKNRTWFWLAGSQDVYYSALNAAGGLCEKFPLSRVGQFGGNLMLMETWTRDGGAGPDDYAVFVMSSGEAIVYQGSYPGAAGDWALVGIYNIGEPMGYRSAVKFGGDLIIITKLDVVRMSEVIQGVEARQMETKIAKAHRVAVSLYEDNWGWEAAVYPRGHMAIMNIPTEENVSSSQHAQNTITGAWARFLDLKANTWQLFNGDIYFGGADGEINLFDSGEDDSDDSIESTFQTAWMPIGGTGGNKLFKAVREAYKTNIDISVSNLFATDFRAFAAQQFPVAVDSNGALWDVSPWDTTPWNAGDTIFSEWETIGAYGERVAMRKRLNTKQRVTLLGYDWLVESGDRL